LQGKITLDFQAVPVIYEAKYKLFWGMFMDEKKSEVVVRRAVQINGSMYVCIPAKYVARHGIEPGDKMAVMMGENLKISPMEREGQ
jgi:hypothetical protein